MLRFLLQESEFAPEDRATVGTDPSAGAGYTGMCRGLLFGRPLPASVPGSPDAKNPRRLCFLQSPYYEPFQASINCSLGNGLRLLLNQEAEMSDLIKCQSTRRVTRCGCHVRRPSKPRGTRRSIVLVVRSIVSLTLLLPAVCPRSVV